MLSQPEDDSWFSTAGGCINPALLVLNGNTTFQDSSDTPMEIESRSESDHLTFLEEDSSDYASQPEPVQYPINHAGHHQLDHSDYSMADSSMSPASAAETSESIMDDLKCAVPGQQYTESYAVAAEDQPEVTNHSLQAQPECIMRPASVSDSSMTTTVSVATHPKHDAVSQGKHDRYKKVRLERLWKYNPKITKKSHGSRKVFIPSDHFSSGMAMPDSITLTEATQDGIPGGRIMILKDSSCAGTNSTTCEKTATRLWHKWRLDNNAGVLITEAQAACDDCKPEDMDPIATCSMTNGSKRHYICDSWAPCRMILATYCEQHMIGRRRKKDAAYVMRQRRDCRRDTPSTDDMGDTYPLGNSTNTGATKPPKQNHKGRKRSEWLRKKMSGVPIAQSKLPRRSTRIGEVQGNR